MTSVNTQNRPLVITSNRPTELTQEGDTQGDTLLDVWLPTTDGRYLVMPRYTEPAADLSVLLYQPRITLPKQLFRGWLRPLPSRRRSSFGSGLTSIAV